MPGPLSVQSAPFFDVRTVASPPCSPRSSSPFGEDRIALKDYSLDHVFADLVRDPDGKVRYVATFVLTKPIDPAKASGLLWHEVPNRGVRRPNVVAEHARAEIDMRVANPAQAEEMVPRILGLKSHDPDVTVTVTGGMNRPPYEKDARIEALFQHARGLAAELGIDLQGLKTGGGSDGNFTAHFVPTLDGLGVDGDGAHTLREHMLLSSLVPRMTLQRLLFETLG